MGLRGGHKAALFIISRAAWRIVDLVLLFLSIAARGSQSSVTTTKHADEHARGTCLSLLYPRV